MKNRLIYLAVIICMIVSLVPVAILAPSVQAGIGPAIYVGGLGDPYSTIQAAIDAASDDDWIVVRNGAYSEDLDIWKPLTITSENGSGSTFIITDISTIEINANNVHLGAVGYGFDITGSIEAYGHSTSDIMGISIIGNSIHDGDGIRFDNENNGYTRDNVIAYNTIYNCYFGVYFDNCVTIHDMYNNYIEGNIIYSCEDGIVFNNDESEGEIYSNSVQNNEIYNCYNGIVLDNDGTGDLYTNTVSSNYIYYCSWGISLNVYYDGDVRDNTVTNNTIHNCEDGIGLYDENDAEGEIRDNLVGSNIVYDCIYSGIELWSEYYYSIVENTVFNNTVYGCDDYDESAGIMLYAGKDGSVYLNAVSTNNVSACSNGIVLESDGGELYYNNVSDNNVSVCIYAGIKLYSEDSDSTTKNIVSNNTVYGCDALGNSSGILLSAGYDGNIYLNHIETNEVHDSSNGIMLVSYDGDLYSNTVADNTIYNEIYYGIYLYAENNGDIEDCPIDGNTVHNCSTGIYLYDNSDTSIDNINIRDNVLYSGTAGNDNGITIENCDDVVYGINVRGNDIRYSADKGLYIIDSESIRVLNNTVRNNYEGIQITSSSSVSITGNDIRDNNLLNATGIRIDDGSSGSYSISINCNNIVSNGEGILSNSSNEVSAEYNWWGNAGGPGVNGSNTVDGDADYAPWLTADISTCPCPAPAVLNTSAVPATVSLYSLFTYSDLYTTGPDYTDLIVEIECTDCPCGIPAATVNITAFLQDLLPADFEATYVSTWSATGQYFWNRWMEDLSAVDIMVFDGDGSTCFLDFELSLRTLFYGGYDYYDDSFYSGWSLGDFLDAEYFVDDIGSEAEFMNMVNMVAGIFNEFNRGLIQVPATLTYCNGSSTTVNVPLVVADFQLPLDSGPNLRSTPVTLNSSWDTLADIMGDGLDDIAAFVTWNTTQAKWVQIGADTVFTPLTSYYIIMENGSTAQMRFIVENALSTPPERTLQAGWNLVASAPPNAPPDFYPYCYPFPAMRPWEALYSVDWTQAVNPEDNAEYWEVFYYMGIYLNKDPYYKEFHQPAWTLSAGGNYSEQYLTAGGGYWVYLNSPDVLAGYSYTPVPWSIYWLIY